MKSVFVIDDNGQGMEDLRMLSTPARGKSRLEKSNGIDAAIKEAV